MVPEHLRSASGSALIPEIVMVIQPNSRSTAFRKPRRVTITIPHATYLELERRSDEQGRSLSNLSAHLLECAVSAQQLMPQALPTPNGSPVMMTGHRPR
jgi:hypothetical protein